MIRGPVLVEYVDSTSHEFYGKTCLICGRSVASRQAVVAVKHEGMSAYNGFMHRRCLDPLLADGPEDADIERVEKIAVAEMETDGLLSWVRSNDPPQGADT